MTLASLALALSFVIGIFLGLLGGGGSVLSVPVFVYAAGMSAEQAISLSLLVVSVTGFLGALPYLVQGLIHQRLAVIFILFGSIGAFFGAKASYWVSAKTILLLFGMLMILISFILFSKNQEEKNSGTPGCQPKFFSAAAISTLLGLLTGFLGVGGGFLIVPVLALLMKCSIRASIGTSLVILSANALAGFLSHWASAPIPLVPAAIYTGVTAGGVLLGSLLAQKISPIFLKKAFAVLVLSVGIFLVIKNLTL